MGTIDDPDFPAGTEFTPIEKSDKVSLFVNDKEKDDLFNATIKERDELKKQNEEMSKALETQATTIAQQQAAIQQFQQALADTTGHVLTLAKAIGRVMT